MSKHMSSEEDVDGGWIKTWKFTEGYMQDVCYVFDACDVSPDAVRICDYAV